MAPSGLVATALLLCFTLSLMGPAPFALGSKACCTSYNRKPIPFHRVKGYREQTNLEHCNIEAIIFYTVKKNQICATAKDKWVRKILELLSSKLKKMSKVNTSAGETETRKSGNGTIFSTAETFPNSTESLHK